MANFESPGKGKTVAAIEDPWPTPRPAWWVETGKRGPPSFPFVLGQQWTPPWCARQCGRPPAPWHRNNPAEVFHPSRVIAFFSQRIWSLDSTPFKVFLLKFMFIPVGGCSSLIIHDSYFFSRFLLFISSWVYNAFKRIHLKENFFNFFYFFYF